MINVSIDNTMEAPVQEFNEWEKDISKQFSDLKNFDVDTLTKIIAEQKLKYDQELTKKIANSKIPLIRYLAIIVDCSLSMNNTDYSPSRKIVAEKYLKSFITNYETYNPLSKIAVIFTKDKKAIIANNFESSFVEHIKKISDLEIEGAPSLDNSLRVTMKLLEQVPKYAQSEIFILYSSNFTVDYNDIFNTIAALHNMKVVCSIISFNSSLHILTKIAEATNGEYNVITNEEHFAALMKKYSHSYYRIKSLTNQISCSLIRVAFPIRILVTKSEQMSLCSCHQSCKRIRYECPICGFSVCELPCTCQICHTMLISGFLHNKASQQSKVNCKIEPLLSVVFKKDGKLDDEAILRIMRVNGGNRCGGCDSDISLDVLLCGVLEIDQKRVMAISSIMVCMDCCVVFCK